MSRMDGAGKAAAPGSEEFILSSIHGTVWSRELLPSLPRFSPAGLRPQTYLFPEEPVAGVISRMPPADQFLLKAFQTSRLLSHSDPKPANAEATARSSCTLHRWDLSYSKICASSSNISQPRGYSWDYPLGPAISSHASIISSSSCSGTHTSCISS